jgi:acetyl-CoA synthetase
MYWVSDMGWMMGPWEVAGMTLLGGTMVLYDGALDYPGPGSSVGDRRATSREHSRRLADADQVADAPRRGTGSPPRPVVAAHPRINRRAVESGTLAVVLRCRREREAADHQLLGRTEVSGGLVGGNVITPLKPAAFAGPPPGIAADVVDDQGRPVRNQVGELVVTQPWIGMTRGFWNDEERYLQTYWSRFPNVWVHGDWAAIDDDGLWYILGRSDDTIKIAGKRLGPRRSNRSSSMIPRCSKPRRLVSRRTERPGAGLLLRAHATWQDVEAGLATRLPRRSTESARRRRASANRCALKRSSSCAICRRRATPRSCAA